MASLGRGTLVLTDDGYYGIMVGERNVALSNGCEEVLTDDQFHKLKVLPMNVFQEGSHANFYELVEGRSPTQQLESRAREMRLMVDDLNEQ